ncbi:MAG TPA: nitroreductase [Firmicutes bacterium]|nr:nitroreductase [Candidatus Fermentithermobacillaceae bacterium]
MTRGLATYLGEERLRAWNEAIADRYSVRSYRKRPVRAEALHRIEGLLAGFSPLCERARGYLVVQDASRIFTGYVGPLGKVTNAPAAVAFAGDFHLPRYMEAIGYLGEGIILEATSLGLATCWMTGSFSKDRVLARVNLPPGWKVIAVTPLGYEAKGTTLGDKALRALLKSDTRKPLSEIVTGLPRPRWPKGLKEAIEAARWAPSAGNAQPWRFRVDRDGVTLSVDTGDVGFDSVKRLSCGIAMLHFEVACSASGIQGSWRFPRPGIPIIAKYRYA